MYGFIILVKKVDVCNTFSKENSRKWTKNVVKL